MLSEESTVLMSGLTNCTAASATQAETCSNNTVYSSFDNSVCIHCILRMWPSLYESIHRFVSPKLWHKNTERERDGVSRRQKTEMRSQTLFHLFSDGYNDGMAVRLESTVVTNKVVLNCIYNSS